MYDTLYTKQHRFRASPRIECLHWWKKSSYPLRADHSFLIIGPCTLKADMLSGLAFWKQECIRSMQKLGRAVTTASTRVGRYKFGQNIICDTIYQFLIKNASPFHQF